MGEERENLVWLETKAVFNKQIICLVKLKTADPNGSAVYGVGLRSLVCWDCGFESRRSVVCCQVEVSASGRSVVQRRPTECGVSECVTECDQVQQ
jgi:hypothetical protein